MKNKFLVRLHGEYNILVKLCGNTTKTIISTDEDPSLRIESSAIINLRGVSTKLNKYNEEYLRVHSLTGEMVLYIDRYGRGYAH